MCEVCEREQAAREAVEAEPVAALRAAEPKRELKLSEILRGDPCYQYRSRAQKRFAAGSVQVTVTLAVEQAQDWDWYWAASRLLTEAGYAKFSEVAAKAEQEQSETLRPYRELADKAADAAMVEYNRVKAEIQATGDWDRAWVEADKVYEDLTVVSRAARNAVREITSKRLMEALAKTFAEIYISEEGTEERTGNDRYYGTEPEDYENDYYDENEDY